MDPLTSGDTVLVTGATGFVGGHVLAELLAEGYRVRCMVRPGSREKLPVDEAVQPVVGDLLRPEDCRRAARGTRAAVHLVGIIRETPRASFKAVHVDGTRNVVEACRAEGVGRLVHMSAHGRLDRSRTAYQRSKAAAERIVRDGEPAWTIFRPSLILGPDGDFLRRMVDLVTPCWRPVPVLGDGRYTVQPVGVNDVARLLAHSLAMPSTEGKTYALGGPEPMTFNAFLDTLCRVVCGRSRPLVHLPMALARPMVAAVDRLMPNPPITREQLTMLQEAEPVDAGPARRDFQWRPEPLEPLLRACL